MTRLIADLITFNMTSYGVMLLLQSPYGLFFLTFCLNLNNCLRKNTNERNYCVGIVSIAFSCAVIDCLPSMSINIALQIVTSTCRSLFVQSWHTASCLLLLSAAPIQGSPQRCFQTSAQIYLHRRFDSVLRRMPFLTQPTDSREA